MGERRSAEVNDTPGLFPLIVPHDERRDPCEFIPDYPTSPEGQRAWEAFSLMTITEGEFAGRPFGEVAAPWQEKLIKLVYSYRDNQGDRIIREVFLLVAKKNGKSALASMWVLAHEILEPETRGQVILIADSRDQASIVYDNITYIVEADPYLNDRFRLRRHTKEAWSRHTDTRVRAIASELANVVGSGTTMFVADELHLIGERPKGEALIRSLTTGQVSRRCPLAVYISTQAIDMPSGIFASMLAKARRIQAGLQVDPSFLPILFEPPEDGTIHDQRYWLMSNPSIGYSLQLKRLEQDYKKAIDDPDPSAIALFSSQHVNIAGKSGVRGFDRWIPPNVIESFMQDMSFEDVLARSVMFWVCVDRGGMDDLEAIVVIGAADHTLKHFYCWSHQICTNAAFEKNRKSIPLAQFEHAGELTRTQFALEDMPILTGYIKQVCEAGPIIAVGLDIHQAPQLRKAVDDVTFDQVCHVVPQGWKLHSGLVWLERSVIDQQWTFARNDLFLFNMRNAITKWAGNSKTLVKHGLTNKIDGVMAWAMGGYLIAQRVNEDRYSLADPKHCPIM